MIDDQEQRIDMKFIAHRGLSALAPENTMAAFRLAAEEKAFDGIECDIHVTADGVFAITHDRSLKRMTKKDTDVTRETFDTVSSVTIINGKHVDDHPDERVPRLEAFLDLCLAHGKTAVVEVKSVRSFDDLNDLLSLFESREGLDVIVISFQIDILKYIRALSDMPLQLLMDKFDEDLLYDARVNRLDLSLLDRLVDRKLVERLRREGFGIAVFTVDDDEKKARFRALGIDYLTTNIL
jgi:glycerophosphoryl diester phosphodiesterase